MRLAGIRVAFSILFSLLLVVPAFGQWSSSDPQAPSIYYNGNVGIGGTPGSGMKMHVYGTSKLYGDVFLGTGPSNNLYLWPDASGPSISSAAGNVTFNGIGQKFYFLNADVDLTGQNPGSSALKVNSGASLTALTVVDHNFSPLFQVKRDGNVGIGTLTPTEKLHVVGNIHVTGNINAKYQDVAEWVRASTEMEPGTVVVLNGDVIDEVMPSSRSYDTTVAGVVSQNPGLILGESEASKEMIATTGRVKVKVDATAGPIAIGDLLVTGVKPGTAMKSQPVEISGRRFHQPGTIIGKALEPLRSGEGEILVLLSLQ